MRPSAEELRSISLFADLGPAELDRLASWFVVEERDSGATLTQQGAAGYAFYVLRDGTATVIQGDEEIRRLGPGDFFGELSIVGPRPEQPQVVAELAEKIPFYRLRHLVRPGLTGWAQVKFRYASSEADALEKLQYEFFYLRRQSLALDLRVVGRTVREVVGREGR